MSIINKETARMFVVALENDEIGIDLSQSAAVANEMGKEEHWILECLKASARTLKAERNAQVLALPGDDSSLIRLRGVSTAVAVDAILQQLQMPVKGVTRNASMAKFMDDGLDGDEVIDIDPAPSGEGQKGHQEGSEAGEDALSASSTPAALAAATKNARQSGMETPVSGLVANSANPQIEPQRQPHSEKPPPSQTPSGIETAVGLGVGIPFGLAALALSPITKPLSAAVAASKISTKKAREDQAKVIERQLESGRVARARAREAAEYLRNDTEYRDALNSAEGASAIKALCEKRPELSGAISKFREAVNVDATVARSALSELAAEDSVLTEEQASAFAATLRSSQEERAEITEMSEDLKDQDGNSLAETYRKIAEAVQRAIREIFYRLGLSEEEGAAPGAAMA